MKIFYLLFAVAISVPSFRAQAVDTTHNFSLTTASGMYAIRGSFTGTFDSNLASFQQPTNFSGSLTPLAGSTAWDGIFSGAISDLTVTTDGAGGWALGFSVTSGDATTYYLANTATTRVDLTLGLATGTKALSAGSGMIHTIYAVSGVLKGRQTLDEISDTPKPYIGIQVPEIDGSKLPQAALLLLALVLLVSPTRLAAPASTASSVKPHRANLATTS